MSGASAYGLPFAASSFSSPAPNQHNYPPGATFPGDDKGNGTKSAPIFEAIKSG